MGIVRPPSARHQPDRAWTFEDSPAHHAAQQRLASVIGVVALALPVVLWASSGCFRASLSAYYFADASGDLLVACLAVIATCLVAFAGETRLESWLTTLAAGAAMGVALFPTDNPGCALAGGYEGRFVASLADRDGVLFLETSPAGSDYFSGFERLARLHDLSALLLLLFLAYLCLAVFTRRVPGRHEGRDGAPTRAKRRRDLIYRLCGTTILASVALMVWGDRLRRGAAPDASWWDEARLTFWVESVALWAFGVAWIVKGRLFGLALRDPGEVTS